ncbi:serine hydrolase domain-containing protein [Longimicrobium sp.]|uniref:serine hydrolase domain-containing protein n=1 Tax=Longimicrobium sp. TaxID=2029185 RepID=UPI002CB2214C|nr:serine hydrolase domain-containing protein [Longimicrobium sp.]HSU14663.1 serine hydrolase domain-containing protein [Longimicrobium sp.]
MHGWIEAASRAMEEHAGPDGASAAAVAVLAGGAMETAVVSRPGVSPAFSADARFLVYSLTKSFIAAAALRLVAAGELELDAPAGRWIPAVPLPDSVTLRHLLQHTSGLGDYGALPEYHAAVRRGSKPWSDAEFLRRTGSCVPLFAPGTSWAYSNVGYMLVRRVLEAARSATLARVLDAEVLQPLGLRRTSVVEHAAELDGLAFGPSRYLGDGEPVPVAGRYDPAWIATGVVASTAEEVARFYHALLGDDFLPPALAAEMRKPVVLGPVPGRPVARAGYGLGLQVDIGAVPGPVYGHTGAGPGASASACHLRDGPAPVTVVALSNGEDVPQVEWMATEALNAVSRC